MRFPQEASREGNYLGDVIIQVQKLSLETDQCQIRDYFTCRKIMLVIMLAFVLTGYWCMLALVVTLINKFLPPQKKNPTVVFKHVLKEKRKPLFYS